MDTPKSFSIDALLSKEASPKLHRAKTSAIAALQGALSPVQGPVPVVSSNSGSRSPLSPAQHPPHGHGAIVPAHRVHPTSSIIPKPGLLNLPPHGPGGAAAAAAAVVPALYAHPLYASYLNGHHPPPNIPHQLSAFHAASEHMLKGSHGLPGVPIEWIRGGMMLPRFGDYPGNYNNFLMTEFTWTIIKNGEFLWKSLHRNFRKILKTTSARLENILKPNYIII